MEKSLYIHRPRRRLWIIAIVGTLYAEANAWIQIGYFRTTAWVLANIAIVFFMILFSRFSVRLRGSTLLAVSGGARRSIDLGRLTRIGAQLRAGRGTVWEISLADDSGGSVSFSLEGYPQADRRELLAILREYADRPGVALDGEVARVFEEDPWAPKDAELSE